MRLRLALAALAGAALAASGLHAQAQADGAPQGTAVGWPHALRVCADPDNMPLSREDGAGFENRIAKLVADDLKLPLSYEWLPDRRGFVRKTLGARSCDVIIGVPVGFERTATTRPYYRSSYVLIDRPSTGEVVSGFDDPRLSRMRIGVQLIGNDLAASSPGHALAAHGHTQNVQGYPVPGAQPAAARIVRDIATGELDSAIVWGPQAGWYAEHARVPLRVHRVAAPAEAGEQPFEYSIAMGVRRGDRELLAALDGVIERRAADIARILDEYAVPRLPIVAAAKEAQR
jgi:mxaJ protein